MARLGKRGVRGRWKRLVVGLLLTLGCGDNLAPIESHGVLRTLTPSEYEASLRAIFGAEVPTEHIGPRSTALASGTAGIGEHLTIAYERSAQVVANWAYREDEPRRAQLTGCEPKAVVADPCLTAVLSRTGRLAFRRSLTSAEQERYVGLAVELGQGDPWLGLAYAVSGLLQSPNFLYRVEGADPLVPAQMSGTSIATRLAYFLWSEPPDDALLRAAESGELNEVAGLVDVAQRMLSDPRAERGRQRILAEVFHVELLDEVDKEPLPFPEFDDALRAAMIEQLERSLGAIASKGPLADLFRSRETFLNDRLAALYDIDGEFGSELVRYDLPVEGTRAGVLTMPGILASRSYPGHTSVALRGLFVRRELLCQPIAPPPADVNPSLRPPLADELVTTRELLAEHQNNATCAGCHSMMDPIGLALEEFDAIGRFRSVQNGLPIDPSGELDGVPFEDAVGLGAALAEHPALDECLAETIASYAVGRPLRSGERVRLRADIREGSGRLHLNDALLKVVSSELFTKVIP